MIKKVVLTGGPHSGKTTVNGAVIEEFSNDVLVVPEMATIMLENKFPNPGKDVKWSEKWQSIFQSAILPLQMAYEDAYELKAKESGAKILLCDRGLLDGAAYTPGGLDVFCKKFNIDLKSALERYDVVIHLESLATVDPEKYGKAGNEIRFEPLERAQEIERATFSSWRGHPKHIKIEGKRGIEGKISEVIGIIRFLMINLKGVEGGNRT